MTKINRGIRQFQIRSYKLAHQLHLFPWCFGCRWNCWGSRRCGCMLGNVQVKIAGKHYNTKLQVANLYVGCFFCCLILYKLGSTTTRGGVSLVTSYHGIFPSKIRKTGFSNLMATFLIFLLWITHSPKDTHLIDNVFVDPFLFKRERASNKFKA